MYFGVDETEFGIIRAVVGKFAGGFEISHRSFCIVLFQRAPAELGIVACGKIEIDAFRHYFFFFFLGF